jgi:hypothetical protein
MGGLDITADEEAIGRRFLKGEITEEQALELIQKL